MNRIFYLSVLIILAITTSLVNLPVSAQTDSVLIIYQDESDLDYITANIDDTFESVTFNSLTTSMIDNAKAIILTSSVEFELNQEQNIALQRHINSPSSFLMVLTPFLDEFEETTLQAIGISNYDNFSIIEEPDANWTIQPTEEFENYLPEDQFSYKGYAAIVQTDQSIIANFTSTELPPDEETVALPSPAIINATTTSTVYTIPTAISQTANSGISIDQQSDFITTLLGDFITIAWEKYLISAGQAGTSGETTTQVDDTTNTEPGYGSPISISEIDLVYALIAIILTILLLLYQRVIDLINWIWRQTLGVLFVIAGVFYNLQDRSLDYNDIMMNDMRVDIINFLEYIGPFGTHLRELKKQMSSGTGSLLWHLQVLQDFELIEQYSIEGHTVFVAAEFADQFDPDLKRIELRLKSKYIVPILSKLEENRETEEIELDEIEGEVDTSRRYIRRILKKIEDEGLIRIKLTPNMVIKVKDKNTINCLLESLIKRNGYKKSIDQTTVTRL